MLGMHTEVSVVMPQKSTKGEIGLNQNTNNNEYKCLYLLHGLSDDNTTWLRRTSIERYALDYGVCVVMPSGGKSFYTDMKYGMNYFSYITEELPNIISEFLKISPNREDTYIAGQSMGGYGALKAALRKPENYNAVAGLSSVADIKSLPIDKVLEPVFGTETSIPDEDDLFYLAEKTNSSPLKPRIYMGVGTEDFLYKSNIKLKEHFEKLDYDFTYQESKGEHNWEFWDDYINHVLKWMFD